MNHIEPVSNSVSDTDMSINEPIDFDQFELDQLLNELEANHDLLSLPDITEKSDIRAKPFAYQLIPKTVPTLDFIVERMKLKGDFFTIPVGVPTTALIDTGAQMTLIDRKLCRRLGAIITPYVGPPINMPTSTQFPVEGLAAVTVCHTVDGNCYYTPVVAVVMDKFDKRTDIACDVLLGTDFLKTSSLFIYQACGVIGKGITVPRSLKDLSNEKEMTLATINVIPDEKNIQPQQEETNAVAAKEETADEESEMLTKSEIEELSHPIIPENGVVGEASYSPTQLSHPLAGKSNTMGPKALRPSTLDLGKQRHEIFSFPEIEKMSLNIVQGHQIDKAGPESPKEDDSDDSQSDSSLSPVPPDHIRYMEGTLEFLRLSQFTTGCERESS